MYEYPFTIASNTYHNCFLPSDNILSDKINTSEAYNLYYKSSNPIDSPIYQIDGNLTLSPNKSDTSDSVGTVSNMSLSKSSCTSYDTDDEPVGQPIPILRIPSKQPTRGNTNATNTNNLITIKRSNAAIEAAVLPIVTTINVRSLYNKHKNFKILINQVGIELCLLQETWERPNHSLTALLQMSGYTIISRGRPKQQGPGGGVAIVCNQTRYFINALTEYVPPSAVECVWAIITPKVTTGTVKRIAVCSVYVRERSRKKTETLDFIISTVHMLKAKYDHAINFIIGGDFNTMKPDSILSAFESFKQLVVTKTRGDAILDLIITDMDSLYHTPSSEKPLEVDEDSRPKV